MNSERWQKVKSLFDEAISLEPERRGQFLSDACQNDAELRREVEILLASFSEAESFMESPAVEDFASLIIEKNVKLESGERVAHYEIIEQIGEGGMGEVYLAKDTRLNRQVALKFLNADFVADKMRLARFKQEAQAASNLNHPNIITIHEIREYNETHLIATEYVKGETLRAKISGGNLKLNEILDIAVQIASALSVAHKAGVVHRDIKPENIMIRPDRIVKLLDFGLAKLTRTDEAKLFDASTQKLTNPGMIMGTVSYMSPEQAQGARVDRRTDIWSLGVLLYEMLSGNLPFSGKTVNHTLVAIMEQKPAPLRGNNLPISAELEQIVAKLLEKEPKNRYQTADDLLAGLRESQSKLSQTSHSGETTVAFAERKFRSSGSEQIVSSIAVLPFLTLGLTEAEEYLGLGLADALITQLSRTKKLAVRPTSAVREFVNSDKNSTEIGRLLNVGSILEGSIQRIGKRLRVTVQLVDAESKNSLWAKKFDIEFADIFAIEDEITTEVADALLLNLNSDEYRRIEERGTNYPQAYQAYLQGRYFWNKNLPEDLPKAIEAFEKAISFDPNFADAYAGIARTYRHILALQNVVEWQTAREKMLRAAANALALDDALAEAHLAIAEIKMDEWDWKFAEREYQRAIALNPNSADARAGYANFLSIFERFDEASKQIERALELDPLSNRLRNGRGKILVMARRYDEAVELLEKTIKIEPRDALAHYFLGYALACKEMFAEAISQYKTAIDISDASPDVFLGYAYARAGERQAALKILEKLKDRKDVSQAELAVIYVGLGETDAALTALEKGFETHDLQMQYLTVEHHYDALRGEPRFNELLKRVGLPEAVGFPTGENRTATDELTKNKTGVHLQTTADRHFEAVPVSPRKFALHRAALGLIILFSVTGAILFYLNGGNFGLNKFFAEKPALSLQTMKINRLSDTSQAMDVAISPDAEFVVFVKDENGKQSLWLRQISAPSSVKIAQPAEGETYGSPAFSPDGSYIFYLKVKPKEARATLFQIPKLGGEEKKMVEDISFQDSGSSFSLAPDGKRVAFIRLDEGFNRSLVITNLEGSNEKKLISRRLPDFLTGAAFSPDGKQIAAISGSWGGRSGGIGGSKNIVLINAEDGTEKPLSEKQWASVEGLTWLQDASGLIVSAAERPGLVQLWHVSVSDGETSRITNDLSDYAAPSLTAKSSIIASVQTNQNSNIWLASPTDKENEVKQLTFGNGGKDGNSGVSLLPHGSGIVYTSQASGNPDIWFVSADGSVNKQLTKDGINFFPAASPDGKYVAFNSDRSGESAIWRMDIDGGNPVQLAKGTMPSFSPDGKWVYFYGTGIESLWKIPVEGGEPKRIPIREKDIATAPVVSPDNTMIACNYLVGEPGAQFRIGVLPIEGGNPLKIFDTFSYAVKTLHWTSDSRALSFIDTREGVSNVFKYPLDGEKPAPVTDFKSGIIWNFDWSNDGKTLALSRGNIAKDVVLISDFK